MSQIPLRCLFLGPKKEQVAPPSDPNGNLIFDESSSG